MLRHALLPLLALASSITAQEWPQFRGPDGLGVARSKTIPSAFGPDENVIWSTDIPAGHSSPCIVGNSIFLTGFEDGKYMVFALDRKGGKMQWKKGFKGDEIRPYAHPDATPALPTPVSDGERVIAYFATYGLISFDLNPLPGNELFTHVHTDWRTGNNTYSASAYACVEGPFGSIVFATICGGYNWGQNFRRLGTNISNFLVTYD